jgi:hypothetical protein
MLAKLFAVALVILAASPLTQPFSTLSLRDLSSTPASTESAVVGVVTTSVHASEVTSASTNPPASVRGVERRDHLQEPAGAPRDPACPATGSAPSIISALARQGDRAPHHPFAPHPQTRACAVLRL